MLNKKGGRGEGSGTQGSDRSRGGFSVLGPDVVVTGNFAAAADLHIDGKVEGDVDCGNLVQGTESHIIGSVTAETARLAGRIEGAIHVRTLSVERSAVILGDVEYESITVETGGRIDGRLKQINASEAAGAKSLRALPTPIASEQAA